MTSPTLYAVIMAGGSGTRFWPASVAARPKQFLPISGGLPMIVETYRRLEGLVAPKHVLVVTAASQVELVRAALPDLPAANILAEPEARNTAPCVAWAAFEIARRETNAIQVVLPADHVIRPAEQFRATLIAAARQAAEDGADGGLYTFGINPTFPATGYGYIKATKTIGMRDEHTIYRVERFVEKPAEEVAREYLHEGGYYWNAGIFVWHTAAILKALRALTPALAAGVERIMQAPGDTAVLEAEYAQLSADPVDIAIMERSNDVRLMPIHYTWNDVGSWKALEEISTKDAHNNAVVMGDKGLFIGIDASHNLAYAEGERVIALIGVQGLAVVQTDEATLVCPLDRAQDVKRIVDELKQRGERFL